ncbi:MAG: hypothetical protein IGS03_06710 [Candidatus Sericytochromatia bacterium]|nr:hypothetical protein [Candidatus Sericytochromatia bacterium]
MLKKDEKSMAQPQPIENELRDRYIAICQSGGSIFQFRRLAQDSEKEYRRGNLYAGAVWASCLADIGRIQEAEKLLLELMNLIPLQPSSTLSQNVHLNYARIMFCMERIQAALKIIADFEEHIDFSLPGAYWMLSAYAALGHTEKIRQIHESGTKKGQAFILSPAILYAYHQAWSLEDFAALFFKYAEIAGIADVNLDTLEQVMDSLARDLIQPSFKPKLFDSELAYLDVIHQTMLDYLAEEEEWEAEAAKEAIQQLNESDNGIIPFEQVVKELGLERLIQ